MSNPTRSNNETPMTPTGSIFETPMTPGSNNETPMTPGESITETPMTPTGSIFETPSPASAKTEDEMLAFQRWSILYNKVRFEFFGASLDEAQDMFEKIKRQMDAEFAEKREAFKGDKEKVDRLNAREKFRKDRYDSMTELLGKLKGSQAMSHKELADFADRFRLDWSENKGDPENGQAERQFESLVSAVKSEAKNRVSLEIEKQYNIPYNDKLMAPIWKQKLQEFFRKNDGEHAQDIKYGLTKDDVDANLSKRVAQAVTAIYSGKLELPGLEIDDYKYTPDAPYQTAQRLVQALDPYDFLDHATRCYFIPNAMTDNGKVLIYYGNRKRGEDVDSAHKTSDEETAIIDDILNGNYEALPALERIVRSDAQDDMKRKHTIKDFQTDYLYVLNGQIQKLNGEDMQQEQYGSQKKRQEQIEADFKDLKDIRNNTFNFTEEDWKNQKNAVEEKIQKEEKRLLDQYSRELPHDKTAFNEKIEKYWKRLVGDMHTLVSDTTKLEKSIAAHLCSAYEPYQEKYGEISSDVLTLHHQPPVPINDDSIKETVDYFRDMLAGGKNSKMIGKLNEINIDRIKQYYDSFILSREAKLQEKEIEDEYAFLCKDPDVKADEDYIKDIKLKSYVRALSEKFQLSQKTDLSREDARVDGYLVKMPTMISPIALNEEGKYDWHGYLKNLIENNYDLKETVYEKIKLKYTNPSISNLANGFSQSLEYSDNYGSGTVSYLKGGKPNFASHNAKIERLKKMPSQAPSHISTYTRTTIVKSEKYKTALKDMKKEYSTLEKGLLVNTGEYNDAQRNALNEEKKQLPQNHPDIFAAHRKESAALTQTFNELHEESQKTNPGCSRKEMLNMLLTTIGETNNPAEAKKKVMASSRKIKRYFFHVWFGAYRNPASTRLRTLLNGLAAKPENSEINPDELMDLHKAAKDLKFSIDGGKNLSDNKLKGLNSYDKDRYALAIKVQNALEKNFKNEKNMLFKDSEKLTPMSNTPMSDTPFGTPTSNTPTPMSNTPLP